MQEFTLVISICFIIMLSPSFSKLLNIPIVVVEITLGLIAGYLGLIYDNEILKLIAKFGFVYLMFLAGLEINLKLVNTIKTTLAWNVVLYFISLYSISALICFLFNLSITYFVILPIFSLGMIMMLIKEHGKEQAWLNLALSIGVVGEVISILALTLFGGWIEYGFHIDFLFSILTIIGVIFLTILGLRAFYVIFWWYPELKKFLIPDAINDRFNQDIRFSISSLLIFISIMYILKIDVVLGSFATGLYFKMFFYQKHNLIEKIESFGFGFFIPIFFIYTGSTVKLEMIDFDILKHAFFIIIAIISIRLISSFLSFYKYLKLKQTILFALSDSMPLTFLVAIAMLTYNYGLISQSEYFSFVIASMIDGLVLMILIRKLLVYFNKKIDK